jgi:hypothetical protein
MNFKVVYNSYYQKDRNDPAFYTWDSPEWVATVHLDEKSLEIWSVGEMKIYLENEEIIRYSDDLISNGIDTDEKLFDIPSEAWHNNSWLELRDYEGEWIGDVWSGHVYHDVQEAVDACLALLQEPEFISEFPCKNPHFVVGSAHE